MWQFFLRSDILVIFRNENIPSKHNHTNLGSTDKHPHSWPPALIGHNLSQASLKAFFQSSIEKFPCWLPKPFLFPDVFFEVRPIIFPLAFVAVDCICGVRVYTEKNQSPSQRVEVAAGCSGWLMGQNMEVLTLKYRSGWVGPPVNTFLSVFDCFLLSSFQNNCPVDKRHTALGMCN